MSPRAQVRCQADGVTAGHVVRSMLAKHGVGWALLQQLYSGFGAAAAFSMAVGAVHWWAFCSAKRAALAALPSSPARAQPAPAAAAPVAVATSRGPADAGERDALMPFSEDGMPFEFAGAAGGGAAAVQQQVPQVALASVALAGGAMTVVEGGPAAASQRQQQRKKQQREREQQQQQGGEGGASAAEGGRELPQQQQQPQHEGGGGDMANRTSANLIAAGVGALCTALVEAPVELFRHQAQVRCYGWDPGWGVRVVPQCSGTCAGTWRVDLREAGGAQEASKGPPRLHQRTDGLEGALQQ